VEWAKERSNSWPEKLEGTIRRQMKEKGDSECFWRRKQGVNVKSFGGRKRIDEMRYR
jgi:hypothetical protein